MFVFINNVALCCHLVVIMECCIYFFIFVADLSKSVKTSSTKTVKVFSVLRFIFFLILGSQRRMDDSCESPSSSSSSSCPPLLTPTGNGPDVIGMFDMDSSDMAMSNTSEEQNFDPRRHSFSEDELKPQPMIKKARKILVPDNMKVRLLRYSQH